MLGDACPDVLMSAQARSFLTTFHGGRLQNSAKEVEEEVWAQVDVPAAIQEEVNQIVSSATADPAGYKLETANGSTEAAADTPTQEAKLSQPAKSLTVEDQTFFVVSATVRTLDMLSDYVRLLINLELVATDVMSKVIEFLKVSHAKALVGAVC